MRVLDTILATALEASIDENWCLLDNQSTYNDFINGKYLSKIINYPYGKNPHVHYNEVVTYTNKISNLPG